MIKLKIVYFLYLILLSLKSHEFYLLTRAKTERTFYIFFLCSVLKLPFCDQGITLYRQLPLPHGHQKCQSFIFSGFPAGEAEHMAWEPPAGHADLIT